MDGGQNPRRSVNNSRHQISTKSRFMADRASGYPQRSPGIGPLTQNVKEKRLPGIQPVTDLHGAIWFKTSNDSSKRHQSVNLQESLKQMQNLTPRAPGIAFRRKKPKEILKMVKDFSQCVRTIPIHDVPHLGLLVILFADRSLTTHHLTNFQHSPPTSKGF